MIIEFVYFIFVSNKSLPTFQLRLPNEKQLVQTISISRQNGKTVFVSLNEFTYLKVWLFLMRQAENRSCYQNFLFLSNFCHKIFRSHFLTALFCILNSCKYCIKYFLKTNNFIDHIFDIYNKRVFLLCIYYLLNSTIIIAL